MDVITRTIVATEAIYSEISFSPDGDVIASPLQSARFPGELTKAADYCCFGCSF